MTDKNGVEASGWIFYDSECALCVRWQRRTERSLRHFKFMPLQSAWARERLGLTDASESTEMRLLLPDGRIFGGADAVLEIARQIWWAWPMWVISKIPGAIFPFRAIYRLIAKNRRCANACAVSGVATRKRGMRKTTTFFEMP